MTTSKDGFPLKAEGGEDLLKGLKDLKVKLNENADIVQKYMEAVEKFLPGMTAMLGLTVSDFTLDKESLFNLRNNMLETFGLDDDRYFHEPKERVTRAEYLKGMEEKRMELTKEITRLFYKGYSSTETAKMLNVSMATVARRKNDAKKLGWIPFRGKFFQSALSWKLEA